MTIYSLAHIHFSIEGSGALVDSLRAHFFGVEAAATVRAAHIRFRFVDDLPPMGTYLWSAPVKVGESVYETTQGGLTFQVRAEKPGWDVAIQVGASEVEFGARAGHGAAAAGARSRDEVLAANFLYDIFDPLTQFIHLENNASYLRASTFERDGRAVALVGFADNAASNSLLEALGKDGWRFLSDELGLINRNAILHPSVSRRSAGAGAQLGVPTKLTDLFFVERANTAKFEQHSISIPNVARQTAVLLQRELNACVEDATALHCASFYPILPRPDDFYQTCFNIARQGFAAQGPIAIRMPLEAGADDLAKFLGKKLGA
ncbi:hypothetical protein [Bradymonas sediminis]|uniref:Uncharacterized protein n=1 Tax=Bradymonas sediminis TaxID=1548548 RepID=A0A2Z4FK00_9DELT|nr:hypothetical protein [Bradymonas sediminis]AWV89307.1 hypothetical protein DN745_08135 [Bradymonas sediminis]TDP73481.1 hypothetical protein DFR33_106121 [Bradymonas sediminis]